MSSKDFQKRYGHNHQAGTRVQCAKPAQQAPALDKDDEGKASSTGLPVVRFRLCRVRLLDVDAKVTAVKDLLDCLQYAGLIQGDREDQIRLEVDQLKVDHYADERTEIEVTYP